jgi:hypothetical protein
MSRFPAHSGGPSPRPFASSAQPANLARHHGVPCTWWPLASVPSGHTKQSIGLHWMLVSAQPWQHAVCSVCLSIWPSCFVLLSPLGLENLRVTGQGTRKKISETNVFTPLKLKTLKSWFSSSHPRFGQRIKGPISHWSNHEAPDMKASCIIWTTTECKMCFMADVMQMFKHGEQFCEWQPSS